MTEHDFKAPIERTSVGIAKVILDKFVENFDLFVFEDNEESKAKEVEIIEKTTDLGIEIMSIMSTTDIPADYASYSIDKILAGFGAMKNFIDGMIRQQQDELIARTLGAKSPVTNTYARDVATLGELMLALNKVRMDTGNNPDDYFIKKKELSTGVDSVVENKE
jgi:hypothetical protein